MRSAVRQIEAGWRRDLTYTLVWLELDHVFGRTFADSARAIAERRRWDFESAETQAWLDVNFPP